MRDAGADSAAEGVLGAACSVISEDGVWASETEGFEDEEETGTEAGEAPFVEGRRRGRLKRLSMWSNHASSSRSENSRLRSSCLSWSASRAAASRYFLRLRISRTRRAKTLRKRVYLSGSSA